MKNPAHEPTARNSYLTMDCPECRQPILWTVEQTQGGKWAAWGCCGCAKQPPQEGPRRMPLPWEFD